MRPSRPSIGIACSQFQCQGSSAIRAEENTTSEIAPSVLAAGDSTLRERNQRWPNIPRYTGTKNMEMPMYWNIRSLNNAPVMPIQLCAGCDAETRDAVLNEGSSGL